MRKEIVDRINATSSRLSKAEEIAISNIDRALARNFVKLEKRLRKIWDIYQEQARLPQEKALALAKELNRELTLTDFNVKPVLRKVFEKSQSEGIKLAESLLSKPKTAATNDFVDFWTEDSFNRIDDWGTAFSRDARAIFELGLSQGWSVRQVLDTLTTRFGQLQFEIKRVVKTGSISTANSTTTAYYDKNGITLVLWLSSRDDRVCQFCSIRNGNIYYLKDITFPLHPSERCFLVPIRRRDFNNGNIDRSFLKQYKQQGLEELRQSGRSPNYGVAPFEKKAGRSDPPKPIWQPDKGFSYGERSRTRRLVDER
jgi:SPP1 gp7 family putative phage head morphogenesis protein